MKPFTTQAIVHSLQAKDKVTIIDDRDVNNVVAEYKGQRYSAVFNTYNGQYYVDDIYGKLAT